jgi:hypothetical protein
VQERCHEKRSRSRALGRRGAGCAKGSGLKLASEGSPLQHLRGRRLQWVLARANLNLVLRPSFET